MGYVVLQRKSQHSFEIIDGQQRLITLSLVMVAARRKLKDLAKQGIDPNENGARAELLTSQFVRTKNPVSRQVDNKLSLNRNNRTYFRAICSNFKVGRR